VEVSCGLSPRQKALYRAIKEKLNVAELLTHSFGDTAATNSDLMNLVMHLRKVCLSFPFLSFHFLVGRC
jgi:DNA helicase INO80